MIGVTIPTPGTYIATRGYSYNPPTWSSLSNSHSQMIDEMWIHRDAFGKVFRIEVSLLQGNSGGPARVRTGHWDDLLSITPGGPDWIGTDRKIYGFGIDLDSNRQPRYDSSRLHYVDHRVTHIEAYPLQPRYVEDDDWGPWQDASHNPSDDGFRCGDSNSDRTVDIGDAVFSLGFLFGGGKAPSCMDAADANDDGTIDIADAIQTLSFLFGNGNPPPAPGPKRCGTDPSTDRLGCERYSRCR